MHDSLKHVVIYTPTKSTKFLAETFRSVLANNYIFINGEFTWLIGVNGGLTVNDIVEELSSLWGSFTVSSHGLNAHYLIVSAETHSLDAMYNKKLNICVLSVDNPTNSIGHLKKTLCDYASGHLQGDVLVELDYDDILADTAIFDIMDTFRNNPDVGFVYSDTINFSYSKDESTGMVLCKTHSYSTDYGWSTYLADAPALNLQTKAKVIPAFEPSARSLCEILYAPNHVRAWTVEAYTRAGGYDEKMTLGDDHDLLIRTYLTSKMRRIAKPLYYYRLHDNNTFASKVDVIQGVSTSLRNRYLHRLVERECALNGRLMVDLGCGYSKPAGWFGIDMTHNSAADMVQDLSSGSIKPIKPSKYQFGMTDEIGAFRMFDFLEHFDKRQAHLLVQDCYDKLPHGGWLLTHTPHAKGNGADCDPTHKSRWNEDSFLYWCVTEKQRMIKNEMPWFTCRWQPVRRDVNLYDLSVGIFSMKNTPYIDADFCALKVNEEGRDLRQPGPKWI